MSGASHVVNRTFGVVASTPEGIGSSSRLTLSPNGFADHTVDHFLPTGTVTLLLADIEGSTRMWENQPDAMAAALATPTGARRTRPRQPRGPARAGRGRRARRGVRPRQRAVSVRYGAATGCPVLASPVDAQGLLRLVTRPAHRTRESGAAGALGVLPGAFDAAAAQTALGSGPVDGLQLVDLLASLIDKSLLTAETSCGRTRYRFSETMRQYASDRLCDGGIPPRSPSPCPIRSRPARTRFRRNGIWKPISEPYPTSAPQWPACWRASASSSRRTCEGRPPSDCTSGCARRTTPSRSMSARYARSSLRLRQRRTSSSVVVLQPVASRCAFGRSVRSSCRYAATTGSSDAGRRTLT